MGTIFRAFLALASAGGTLFGADVASPVSAMWSGMIAVLQTDDADHHRQALIFLKAAYDRLEAQIRAAPDRPWIVSLRSEQAAVMQRIREEITLLSGDVPPEIALLLAKAGSSQPTARAPAGAPL
ncbi:MAG TPA: hypothetical protein VEK82_15825 [Stellaceae bacterium]|nr:hypothetical protein [Stellaceae bacterium]